MAPRAITRGRRSAMNRGLGVVSSLARSMSCVASVAGGMTLFTISWNGGGFCRWLLATDVFSMEGTDGMSGRISIGLLDWMRPTYRGARMREVLLGNLLPGAEVQNLSRAYKESLYCLKSSDVFNIYNK